MNSSQWGSTCSPLGYPEGHSQRGSGALCLTPVPSDCLRQDHPLPSLPPTWWNVFTAAPLWPHLLSPHLPLAPFFPAEVTSRLFWSSGSCTSAITLASRLLPVSCRPCCSTQSMSRFGSELGKGQEEVSQHCSYCFLPGALGLSC